MASTYELCLSLSICYSLSDLSSIYDTYIMALGYAHASSSRAMQVDDFDDDDMVEGDVDGREVEDDLEQWTVDTFKSLPMTGESAATMVSTDCPMCI